jgi:UDP-N-acetylmuramoyl-tripeptide--D-alanyl-D-alanine ligase
MQASAPGRVLYYGLTDESNLWATDLKTTPGGLAATVHYRSTEDGPEETWPLKTLLLGRHQLSGILAALGAALVNGVSAEEALAAVASIGPPPGRGRVLAGKHDLTLIDDSYNASPQAVMASLEVLQQFPGPRIAVLGDMRELGRAREAGHRSVGEFAAGWLDELITVGDDAALIGQAAAAAGMKPEAIHQATAKEAAELIEAKHRGGTVLVKGSQAVYLERTVAALLADPRDAARLVKRRIPTDAP